MTEKLSMEQVLRLAPDPASIRNGKKLGIPAKWLTLGTNGDALWGEVEGSGKNPYQTGIDISNGPAYLCGCSSRKIPCKHAIGLMMVLAQAPDDVPEAEPPEWVQEWLDKRIARLKSPTVTKEIDREAQAKRFAKRQANIQAGLDEIDLWLKDLVRAGLASAQTKPRTFWETPAKRLVDAQAPALAERVRSLSRIIGNGETWVEDMLAELSQIHFIIQGFRRLDALPEPMRADLRTVVGWSLQLNELTDLEGVRDHWLVMGHSMNSQDKLRVQRYWLCGLESGQVALLLEYAYGNAGFDNNLLIGTVVEAELVFYPSAYPLRAVIRDQGAQSDAPDALPGYPNFRESINAYAAALSKNPWVTHFPVAYTQVVPSKQEDGRWLIADEDNNALPLHPSFRAAWELFAVSGGRPAWVAGEWTGKALYPLTVAQDGQIVSLNQRGLE